MGSPSKKGLGPVAHTPGPWRVTRRGFIAFGEAEDNATGYVKLPSPWREGAWLHDDDAEAKANAHLIAAAPELLEALKFAASVIGHPADDGSKLIVSVIAKAEGRLVPSALLLSGGRTGAPEWQDIASAPKDGEPVDLWGYWPEHDRWKRSSDARWRDGEWEFGAGWRTSQFQHPPRFTHWMRVSGPSASLPAAEQEATR